MNILTHLDFWVFPMGKCNATVKKISSKMEAISWLPLPWRLHSHKKRPFIWKYLKFTSTIHINPNSYSFRIMFIMIIVRFFIICFINGWKYEKVATNWDGVTNWCVSLITFLNLKSEGFNLVDLAWNALGLTNLWWLSISLSFNSIFF